MNCETKSSIEKLRKLRDELCKNQKKWDEAFKIKDEIVTELKNLKDFTESPKSTKKCISGKIDNLLILLDPDRENEKGNCDE
jgi:hypothetical protein